jgi:NAD(P)-dependent dehydrogenase (short-subunit alcohol dehydrogenase family)
MNAGLRGKSALVTGAVSGIGRAISLALAREGVDVAMVDLRADPDLAGEMRALGVKPLSLVADVSEEGALAGAVSEALATFEKLDLYVNNAAGAWHQPFTRITTEAWLKTLNTNLTACMWGCREVSRHMVSRRQGSILIVGSTAQFNPGYAEGAYNASKLALRSLCGTLAIEMAPHGIRVNLLVPGHHLTGLTSRIAEAVSERVRAEIPLRRFGDVEACGTAAVFLLSDELSPYTTGAELVVDGGLHLRPLRTYQEAEVASMNLADS